MEEIKRKNKHSWFGQGRLTSGILGVLILLPFLSFSALAEPPEENQPCIAFAYTESENHLFLLGSNKSIFGTKLTVEHNCESVEIIANGNFTGYSELNKIEVSLNVGINNVTISGDNQTFNYYNVTVMPDRLTWAYDYYEWKRGDAVELEKFISITAATAQANWASILSIVVVFSLVTMVYWNLINSYIDKNYCEEVTK